MADISDLPAPSKSYPKADFSDLPTPPKQKSFGEKAFEFVEPTVEAVGTAGGALLGSALGPAGTVGGAGLGYGMSREAMRLAKEQLGYAPPRTGMALATEPVKDILTGATMEAGGQVAGQFIEKAGKKLGGAVASVKDMLAPEVRAGKIARESFGQDLPKARQILAQATDDLTASQVLASIDPKTGKPVLNAPVAQALLQRAAARDSAFFTNLLGEQEAKRLAKLNQIAGGADQTSARAAREEMKKMLNERLIPTLETELGAANIAGKLGPKFKGEAERMGAAAGEKVEDVRRFTAAGERAIERAKADTMGRPTPPRYTYMGELAKRAEDVSNQAANASLRFGDARRFAEAANQSLEAHGLKPLETAPIIANINRRLNDPAMAGNTDVQRALGKVATDIQKWTNNGGVIDAFALDSIRKNSVNAAIRELYPTADAKTQKEVAARVLEAVRPALIDAIEAAGGTGYRQYLRDYSLGMQQIAQTKLGAEALQIYQTNPKAFVELVQGNAPEVVEKIFGAGNYNLAKEMSVNAQNAMRRVASEVERGEAISGQAKAGQEELANLLKENISKIKFPAFFSAKATTANALLDSLEGLLNKRTMKALTEGAKSAQNLEQLLNTLPAAERSNVLKVLRDPATYTGIKKAAGSTIAGVSQREPKIPPPDGAGGINDMNPRLGQ